MKSGNVSSLSFYDIVTSSTGTFRYSTLTASGLTSLPPVSLLYFNNFVVAGAYVWPGQTIAALDSYILSNTTVTHTNSITINGVPNATSFTAATGTFGIMVCSTISGGTPPYNITDTNLTGTTLCNLNLRYFVGTWPNNKFGYITGTYGGSSGVTYNTISALTDSSTPPFTRYITVNFVTL